MIINNIRLYDSIKTIPAQQFFAFQCYYNLFEACSEQLLSDFLNISDSIITNLINLKNDYKEAELDRVIYQIENNKVSQFNTVQGLSYHLLAFTCLFDQIQIEGKFIPIPINTNKEEDLLQLLLFANTISSNQIIEEIRKINDVFQNELETSFDDLFSNNKEYTDFNFIKFQLASLDLDKEDNNAVFNKIHEYFLRKQDVIIVNKDFPDSYFNEFWQNVTEHYLSLGYTEKDMREVSVYSFFTKNKLNKKRLKEAVKEQVS